MADIGIFNFALGKNMPCLGGGAIADDEVAERACAILADAAALDAVAVRSEAVLIWISWLLTRPLVFGLSVYPALRLKLSLGKPLMDSAVGNELLERFRRSEARIERLANLLARIGLLQLEHIDTKLSDMSDCATLAAFSEGGTTQPTQPPMEAAVLKICVCPALSERQMRRIASVIRGWANSSSAPASSATASPSRS